VADVGEQDVGALAGQLEDDGPPDAAPAAGDQSQLSPELLTCVQL
jgi:hypothetical protein